MSPDDTFQQNLQAEYEGLLAQYTAAPFSSRHKHDDLEKALDWVECRMLDNPPWCKGDDGAMGPRATGLVEENRLIDSGEVNAPVTMSLAEAGITKVSKRDWPDIIDDPNRTPPADYCPFTHDQNGYGSCAGEGSAGSGACRRYQDGQAFVELNGFWNYLFSSGGVDRGSSLKDNIAVMMKYGCCSTKVRPRSRGFRAAATEAEYEDAAKHKLMPDGIIRAYDDEEIGTLVLSGFPVFLGYPGHAVFVIDVLSTTRLKFKNSWGDWGVDGNGTMTFSRVEQRYGMYAFVSMGDKEGD